MSSREFVMIKMKRKLKRTKEYGKAGFSLAELLIVVCILLVLCSVAAVAAARYMRTLHQFEMDATAKEEFVAAQNHLSMVKSLGYMDADDDTAANGFSPLFGNREGSTDIYYYITDGKSSESASGGYSSPDGDSRLSLLLPFGSIDESVRRKGSYIIRYNKTLGVVMDVFYAESTGRYGHTFLKTEYAGLMSGYVDTETESRKELRRKYGADNSVLGYYGGASADTPGSGDEYAIPAPRLDIENGDVLKVKVTAKLPANYSGYNLKLKLTGASSGAEAVVPLVVKAAPESSGFVSAELTGTSVTAEVILDRITIGTEDAFHFAEFASSVTYKTGSPRLLVGEDILIQAVADNSVYLTNIGESLVKTTNSLYSSLFGTNGGTAYVSSLRHLENLDPGISGRDDSITVAAAKQTTDLKWDDTDIFGNYVFNDSHQIIKAGGNAYGLGLFIPVNPDAPLSYDGQDHSITGLTIKDSSSAGLFASLPSGSEVYDLTLKNFRVTSLNAESGALAGCADNTLISGVLVTNDNRSDDSSYEIHGKTSAGGLAGIMSGGSAVDSAAAVYVSSDSVAGGLVGSLQDGAALRRCYAGGHTQNAVFLDKISGSARVNVMASAYAGGLVGVASDFTVSGCYATASARSLMPPGGLIGNAGAGTVSHCYCTGRVITTGIYSAGAYVGSYSDSTVFSGESYYLNGVSDDVRTENLPGVIAVSAADTGVSSFILDKENRQRAIVYDDALMTTYLGKYYFPTIDQWTGSIGKGGITDIHNGDWQIPGVEASDLLFINEDTLRLEIDLSKQTDAMTLSLTGAVSGATKVYVIQLRDNKTTAALSSEGSVRNRNIVWDNKVSTAFPMRIQNGTLVITLDDITTQGSHFREIFASDFIPGENISARLSKGAGKTWHDLENVAPVTQNSLFALGTDISLANLRYIRHLQNLDPVISDVSALVTKAILIRDLSWSSATYPRIYRVYSGEHVSGSFYGICNSSLTEFNGAYYSIKNLYTAPAPPGMSPQAAENSGLFRLVDNGMTLKNLKLEDCTASASHYAGGAVAEITGSGASFETVLVTSGDTFITQTGSSYAAGGLAGRVSGSTKIRNSAASQLVFADGTAGGLVGRIDSGTVSITQSYSGGHTDGSSRYAVSSPGSYNVVSSAQSAGGLIGAVQGGTVSLYQSFSAASASAPGTQCAGGLIGKVSSNVSLSQSYAVAPVRNTKVRTDDSASSSGAFIGEISSGKAVTVSDCYYLPEVFEGSSMEGGVSSVAYIGRKSGTLNGTVGLAYYTRDDDGNIISAKLHGETMQVRTSTFDASLLTSHGSKREYPFSVWTKFPFDETDISASYRSYYGDWQPIINEATVLQSISFFVIKPDEASATDLGSKSFIEGQKNTVLLPGLTLPGYDVNLWELYYENEAHQRVSLGEFPAVDGFLTVSPENAGLGSLFARAIPSKKDSTCIVSFYYDPSGGNSDFRHIVTHKAVTDVTKMSDITEPVRTLSGYVMEGWYSDPSFSETSRLNFAAGTAIHSDIRAYARYIPLEYYYVTINYKYQIGNGEQQQLVNVPQYQIDDPSSQYRIKIAKGEDFSKDIACPDFGGQYAGCEIILTNDSAETDPPGSITESSQSSGSQRVVHVSTDPGVYEDYSFSVIYKVPEAQALSVYCYKIVYRMGHTSGFTGSTASPSFTYGSGSYEYLPYSSGSSPTIFMAPQGETCPDIILTDYTGFKRLTSRVNLQKVPWTEGGIQKTDSSGRRYYIVYVDYERNRSALIYESNGGTYIDPVNLYVGEPLPSVRPNPERKGYRFTGWANPYKKGEPSAVYSWSSAMPDSILVTEAAWTPENVSYRVSFWYENADSQNKGNKANYSYMGSAEKTGRTGSTIESGSFKNYPDMSSGVYPWMDTTHFSYNSALSETVTIANDGTTVINVYYARNKYTLTFKASSKCQLDEHTHGPECYVLACGHDEEHTHTDACYQMTCTLEEHTHSAACETWICQKEVHTHSDSCRGYICGKQEHTHSAACYKGAGTAFSKSSNKLQYNGNDVTITDQNTATDGSVRQFSYTEGCETRTGLCIYIAGNWYTYSGSLTAGGTEPLICGKTPHTHSSACVGLICGKEEHTHSPGQCYYYSCGKTEHTHDSSCGGLVCGKDEHTHSDSCHDLECGKPQHTHDTNCTKTQDRIVYQITARYEAPIAYIFEGPPFSTTYKGNPWKATDSKVYSYALQTLDRMPGANVTFNQNSNSTNTEKTITYYVQKIDTTVSSSAWPSSNTNFDKLKEVKTFFNYMTYNEEYHEILGFTRYSASVSGFNSNQKNFSNNKASLYYMRNRYNLEFYSEGSRIKTESVPYEKVLSSYNYEPAKPSGYESYTFGGWYADEAASEQLFDFSGTMPAGSLSLYARWVPPVHTVNFYLERDGETQALTELLHSFEKEHGKDLDNEIAKPDGTLKEAYKPAKDKYDFDGWFYTDAAGEKPFFSSIAITRDMDIYGKWTLREEEKPVEKRNVFVYYIGRNSDAEDDITDLGSTVIPDQKVGITVTQVAQSYEGWYADKMVLSVEVDEDETNNIITFFYKPVGAWRYSIEYYAVYGSNYDDPEAGLEERGYSFAEETCVLVYRDADKNSYNIYDTIAFDSGKIPAEIGNFSNYSYTGYRYQRNSGEAEETGDQSVVSISDMDSGNKLIKFYMRPDATSIQLESRSIVYDGQSQAGKTKVADSEKAFAAPPGYTTTLWDNFAYFTAEGSALDDEDVKNAGAYGMDAYAVLELRKGEDVKHFLLWRETDHELLLQIEKRPVTLVSVSAEALYDNDRILSNLTLSPEDESMELLVPDGTPLAANENGVPTVILVPGENSGFVEGEGAQYSFTVDAFRKDIGMSDNSFTYTLNEGTDENNYLIKLEFGTLTVYWEYEIRLYARFRSLDAPEDEPASILRAEDFDSVENTAKLSESQREQFVSASVISPGDKTAGSRLLTKYPPEESDIPDGYVLSGYQRKDFAPALLISRSEKVRSYELSETVVLDTAAGTVTSSSASGVHTQTLSGFNAEDYTDFVLAEYSFGGQYGSGGSAAIKPVVSGSDDSRSYSGILSYYFEYDIGPDISGGVFGDLTLDYDELFADIEDGSPVFSETILYSADSSGSSSHDGYSLPAKYQLALPGDAEKLELVLLSVPRDENGSLLNPGTCEDGIYSLREYLVLRISGRNGFSAEVLLAKDLSRSLTLSGTPEERPASTLGLDPPASFFLDDGPSGPSSFFLDEDPALLFPEWEVPAGTVS